MNRFPMSPPAWGGVGREGGETGTATQAHCWLFLNHEACERLLSFLGGQRWVSPHLTAWLGGNKVG